MHAFRACCQLSPYLQRAKAHGKGNAEGQSRLKGRLERQVQRAKVAAGLQGLPTGLFRKKILSKPSVTFGDAATHKARLLEETGLKQQTQVRPQLAHAYTAQEQYH